MKSHLPPRPNLDHLRSQAKTLLAALEAGDKQAIATMREHLPAARMMSPQEIRATRFRLADAQSAIARKTGFAAWPQLARHVEQLRALEGTWEFDFLEVEGRPMPAPMLTTSRVLIDGDRFRSETPGATYEGVFNINVESDPHQIDLNFIEGPEAGNANFGIFRLESDLLHICLDMYGKPRPTAFKTAPQSGHALETLRRASATRPASVSGGTAPLPAASAETAAPFEYVDSPTLQRLQGDWSAVKIVKDGGEMPAMMCNMGKRTAVKNEIKISFGGQVMIHALVRVVETTNPVHVDYYNLAAPLKGVVQQGIMQWIGDDACFCMAAPGQLRPADFTCAVGSGRTLSQWRIARK